MNITYTFSKMNKGKIHFRYRDENKQSHESIIADHPITLFIERAGATDGKSYFDKPLEKREFKSPREASKFVYSMKDNPIKIHGNSDFAQQFVIDLYGEKEVTSSTADVRIGFFDIEIAIQDEFPDPTEVKYPINAITIYDSFTDKYYVTSLYDYDVDQETYTNKEQIVYTKSETEEDLIEWILQHFEEFKYDIITGWNSRKFDIPYIINRFNKVVGEAQTNRLSPFGVILSRETKVTEFFKTKIVVEHEIFGMTHIDYMEMYQKKSYTNLDSYSLANVAEHEVGEGKLSYEEEGSLFSLYVNNPQKFVSYNIKDVDAFVRVEKKRRLFDIITMTSFFAKANFDAAMGTTKLWEAMLATSLNGSGVAPLYNQEFEDQGKSLPGGLVLEPRKGRTGWGLTFDAASLN